MLDEKGPWNDADPTRKISINLPLPEPLMAQLNYLIEKKAIRSKSSFIRDSVTQAAQNEIMRVRRIEEAVRKMDEEENVAGLPDSRAGSRGTRSATPRRGSKSGSGAR